jgi:hypothetical protein
VGGVREKKKKVLAEKTAGRVWGALVLRTLGSNSVIVACEDLVRAIECLMLSADEYVSG